MPTITVDRVITLLSQYARQAETSVDVILVGALALQAYGYRQRLTHDVDAEITGPLEPLLQLFTEHHVPADLTHNFSGWSVVAMPPGYRDRATDLVKEAGLHVRVLAPADFVIAKLRRGIEVDLEDAAFVVRQFGIPTEAIRESAAAALAASPQDTALFLFKKTVEFFCKDLEAHREDRPS